MTDIASSAKAGSAKTGTVLLTLAAGQFLMTLDSSVMNVSIATVAEDVGTSITGIQTAITLYTLVMAMLMIPGGKVGSLIGRKRAFAIGCVIYGLGSLTTALAPNLPVLILGWSLLEGVGAALILPAIVALVAGNVPVAGRPRAYGLIMAAGAIAVAVGPLIGGIATTYFSWRWVFAGEVRGRAGDPGRSLAGSRTRRSRSTARLDLVGAVLSAAGLGLAVFGVLRSSEWGWVLPKPGGPDVLGLSPTIVLILAGLFVLWLFTVWEQRVVAARRRAARAAGDVRQPSVHRRPGDVLLPVPGPGRAVLHHPALPVGGARPVGDRHRSADHAAVDHPAARGGGHPAVLPERVTAPGRPGRPAGDVRRDRRPVHGHGRRCRAPRSSRCRCCSPGSGSARSPRSWAA